MLLKLTVEAPENGWLEDDPFLLGQKANFQGELLVLGESSYAVVWKPSAQHQEDLYPRLINTTRPKFLIPLTLCHQEKTHVLEPNKLTQPCFFFGQKMLMK